MKALSRNYTDPDLLDAYRKQLRNGAMPPGAVFLMWHGQAGIHPDDLLDEFKLVDGADPA